MIWSVSMLSPNFQARPRMVFGRVTGPASEPASAGSRGSAQPLNAASAGTRGYSCQTGRHLVEHLARVGDHARDRARRGHSRVGEVDLRLGVAHATRKVAVGRAQAD